MSIFTMSLAEVIEFHGRDNIGLDRYPVIAESYRQRLNDKIIDQYLNREIGQESVSLWRHAMRRKMAQIMPMYNQLYETETLIIDPMRTVDLRTLSTTNRETESESQTTGEASTTSETESTSGSKSRNVNSDTPQVMLSGEGNYATNAADAKADATATGEASEVASSQQSENATAKGTDVMESNVSGFQGNQAQMLADYRATILNIDMLIVDELETLFMGIWNNGDTFYPWRRF